MSKKKERKNADSGSSEMMIYGRNPVSEALQNNVKIIKLIIDDNAKGNLPEIVNVAKDKNIEIARKDKDSFRRFLQENSLENANNQGVIAVIPRFEYSSVERVLKSAADKNKAPFIVLLDGIEDPHNLGAIIRVADGAGVHGVIIPERNACEVNETVIKVSSGAALYMPVVRVKNLARTIDELKKKDIWMYGLDMNEQIYYDMKYDGSVGLVIGAEGRGLSRLVKEKCDFLISIPMRGKMESLNASNAGAVAMYEIAKQNR